MSTSTITKATKCSDTAIGLFHCESMSDTGKFYDVILEADGRNTCTCMAFVFSRNKRIKRNRENGFDHLDPLNDDDVTCKHIQALQARNGGCGWTSDSKEKQEYPNICPRCYAKAETYSYDTRDPKTVDLDELMADFLALKKKLKKARS